MSKPAAHGATVLNFSDFLEPPQPVHRPGPGPGGVALEPPVRDGLGAAPAPALGADEAKTVLDPEVWFAAAADPDPVEPATVLVPEDVVRVAQQLAEEARARFALVTPSTPAAVPPQATLPSIEVDLDRLDIEVADSDDDAGDAELFAGPMTRLWRRRRPAPLIAAGACLALFVAGGAWIHAAAPARVEAPSHAPPPAPVPAAAPVTDFTIPRPIADPAPAPSRHLRRRHLRQRRPRRLRRRESRGRHHLHAPTARRSRTDVAARDLRRGRADYDLGDLRGALRWYLRAARVAPRDPDARFGVALAAYELHEDRRAWHSLEGALRLDPAHADSNLLLGFMLQEDGRDKDAAVHYARYLKAAPDGEWARDVRSTLAHLGE